MKVLDFHIHISEHTPVEEVLSFLDRLQMDRGAILATDHGPQGIRHGTNVSWRKAANLAEASGGRLYAVGSVHPDSVKEPAKELETMLEAGVKGCKLYPHSGFYPDDRRLDEMYALAQDKEVPVLIHTGIKAHRFQQMKYNEPIYIDNIAVRFPQLHIVIMHAGYPWVEEALLVAKMNENVIIDLTFLDVLEYTFAPGLTESVIRRCMHSIGDQKIVWGSEGEWLGLSAFEDKGADRVKEYLNRIKSMDFISEDSLDRILYENAARLLHV